MQPDTPTVAKPASRHRWAILALLFAVTTINYMDRNILGVLKRTIQADLHFNETDFGNIIFFFFIAYAVGYDGMGWLTDKVGVRLGLAAAATIWCLASTAHGTVASVGGFILARIVLGLGEGGNFPTCIKTVATWFSAACSTRRAATTRPCSLPAPAFTWSPPRSSISCCRATAPRLLRGVSERQPRGRARRKLGSQCNC